MGVLKVVALRQQQTRIYLVYESIAVCARRVV